MGKTRWTLVVVVVAALAAVAAVVSVVVAVLRAKILINGKRNTRETKKMMPIINPNTFFILYLFFDVNL